ncbi:hypothetical protein D3C80_1669690 [compost metagenome]
MLTAGLDFCIFGNDLGFDRGGMFVDDSIDLSLVFCGVEGFDQFACFRFFGFGIGLDRQSSGHRPSLGFQGLHVLLSGVAQGFLPFAFDQVPGIDAINCGTRDNEGDRGTDQFAFHIPYPSVSREVLFCIHSPTPFELEKRSRRKFSSGETFRSTRCRSG